MSSLFGKKQTDFSIDDAFDIHEVESSLSVNPQDPNSIRNQSLTNIHNRTAYQSNLQSPSTNEESLISDEELRSNLQPEKRFWFLHPRILANWKTVLFILILDILGIGLLALGVSFSVSPDPKYQGSVLMLTGMLLLIPGIYYSVIIYLAATGDYRYDSDYLPIFS